MGYLVKANAFNKEKSKHERECSPTQTLPREFQAMELRDPRNSGRLFPAGGFSHPSDSIWESGHFRRASEKPVISLSPVS